MKHSSLLAAIAFLATACLAGEKPAAKPAGDRWIKGNPLAKMPSAEGPHIARIKALKDGEWLSLGRPKPDPKWGEGRGRSWCQKMNFAADLRGAYYTGEGVHAYIKPDKHYMDDHFFYDVNAHAWVCLHPGVKAGADQGLKLGDTGLLVNEDGDPIPCGLLAHNYDQTTYDSHQKKFAFIPKGGSTGWWITMKCKQVKALQKPASAKMKGKGWSPWYYNTKTGKFEREVIKSKGPIGTSGGGCFMYLPRHKKFYLCGNYGSAHWLYDSATKSWSKAARFPAGVVTGYDSVSCYDSKRGLLYMAGGSSKKARGVFVAFDAGTNTWTKLPNTPKDHRFTGNSGCMTYDSANDVIVASIAAGKGLYFYSPEKKKWLSDEPVRRKSSTGFYDPQNNVHYYISAGDSRDKGVIWVYRYKKAKTPGAAGKVAAKKFKPNPKLAAMPEQSAILLTERYTKGRGVMDYSAMVYDRYRHKILAFGGGHAAPGFPNSVHEFDMDTLKWQQLTENVPQAHHVKANAVLDKDGKPLAGVKHKGKEWAVSRHTYDGLVMATDQDLMLLVQCVTSAGYSGTPKADWPWFWGSAIWKFDPVKREWSVLKKNGLALSYVGSAIWPKKPDWVYLYSQLPSFRAVNWKTGELRKLARPPRGGLAWSYAGLQYYPEEEVMIAFPKGPKGSGGMNKIVYKFDLKTEKWRTKEVQGDAPTTHDRNAVYDSRNKVFVAYDNKGTFHYYSPRENRWYKTKKVLEGVKDIRHHHIYDPVNNVHVILGWRWKTAIFKLSDAPGKLPGTGKNVKAKK